MPRRTLRLNTHALAGLLRARDVKQWWLADRVGVARKTVGRWVNGRVKRIDAENAHALATVLGCAVSDLTLADDADVFATREEHRRAARLIRERGLVSKLAPTDDWELAEGLVRAALSPELPLVDLGHLYSSLSTVCWRRGRYHEAAEHARRAREIAREVGDRLLEIAATFDLAVVESFVGSSRDALAAYESVLALPESLHSPAGRAATYSNTGRLLRSFRRFDESVAAQREAIRRYADLGADYNLAIAWTSLGVVLAEGGSLGDALTAFRTAEVHAETSNYHRGVASARLYQADVLARTGELDAAVALVTETRPALDAYEVYDLTGHECAARVHRIAGDPDAARAELELGLSKSERFAEIRGSMLEELERLEASLDRPGAAADARTRADAAFAAAGLAVRMRGGGTLSAGCTSPPSESTGA